MKTTIEIKLKPFTTPNYVIEEGATESDDRKRIFSLSELDSMTLHRLCNQFRDEVFRKAGKEQPPEEAKP